MWEEPEVNDIVCTVCVINSHRKDERPPWNYDDEEKAELEKEKYVGDEEAMEEYLND